MPIPISIEQYTLSSKQYTMRSSSARLAHRSRILIPSIRLTARNTAFVSLQQHPKLSSNRQFTPFGVPGRSHMSTHAQPRDATTVTSSEKGGTAAASFTIVGGGRVGSALQDMGQEKDTIIGRDEAIQGPPGPIVVCTRNDALQDVVDRTPESRRKDLVFIQNGMLQPWLDERGLGDNTQVLVFFAVAKKGDPPTDGKTDTNPEGLTAATGPWAEAFASRLHVAGLSCKVLGKEEYKKAMLEKLIWICSFMLVGTRHSGCTVGEVESRYREEVGQLICELASAGSAALEVELDEGYEERLCAYARSVAHFPTAVKEFQWRNGWFYGLTQEAEKQERTDPCPLHTQWLKDVGAL